MKTRKLKDNSTVAELDQSVILTIKTKCPAKWLLIDQETGEAYIPYDTEGSMQWKKIYKAEWSVNA